MIIIFITIVHKVANVDDYHSALTAAGPNLVVFFFYSSWSCPSIEMEKELLHLQYECPEGNNLIVFSSFFLFYRFKYLSVTVEFSKIDVDTNGEVSEAYSVVRMPTIVFIKHSKTIDRLSEPDIKTLRDYVDHYR